MFEFMKMAFAFGLGFIGAVALYVAVGYGAYRLASWIGEEVRWRLILWRNDRNEKREAWEKQKADLIAYTERAAGEK